MEHETIAAIATPVGVGGIGIIRISGKHAFKIISRIFVPKNTKLSIANFKNTINIEMVQSHKLYYGNIIIPEKDNFVDEVLVAFMKSPNTYTTEDIVEIQAHSGFVALNRLFSIVLENGAKIAEPGEFTKRAFLNGRIDLTQAEGIINLINAKTSKAAAIAAKCIAGSTKSTIEKIRLSMCKIQADYEVIIDFTEQSCEKTYQYDHSKIINKQIFPKLELMLTREKEKVIYQDGFKVLITGAPNVGKSSLMNKLLGNDRTIVTDIPGTTRNIIKDYMTINRLPVVLYDTAGIHNTSNVAEQIGINKSKKMMEKVDIILLVIDAYKFKILNSIEKNFLEGKYKNKIIVILNKIDLCTKDSLKIIEQNFIKHKIIKISAKENLFINKVKSTLFKTFIDECEQQNNFISIQINSHQYTLLKKIKMKLNKLLKLIKEESYIDILSYNIGECIDMLDEISGTGKKRDLQDYIFSKFCIGK